MQRSHWLKVLWQSITHEMLWRQRFRVIGIGPPDRVLPQMLVVTEKDAAAPSYEEARHGVTPPMRDARARHFRVQPDVPAALVAKTEQDLLAILAVRTPMHSRPACMCAGCLLKGCPLLGTCVSPPD